jgi:hypothetical protein
VIAARERSLLGREEPGDAPGLAVSLARASRKDAEYVMQPRGTLKHLPQVRGLRIEAMLWRRWV